MSTSIKRATYLDWGQLSILMKNSFPELSAWEISRLIINNTKSLRIAKAGNRVIGFYQFQPSAKGTAWLNYISVEESSHGQQIGAKLLVDFEAQAAAFGFDHAELQVSKKNIRAIEVYKKNGYRLNMERKLDDSNSLPYIKTLQDNVTGCSQPVSKNLKHPNFLKKSWLRVMYKLFVRK